MNPVLVLRKRPTPTLGGCCHRRAHLPGCPLSRCSLGELCFRSLSRCSCGRRGPSLVRKKLPLSTLLRQLPQQKGPHRWGRGSSPGGNAAGNFNDGRSRRKLSRQRRLSRGRAVPVHGICGPRHVRSHLWLSHGPSMDPSRTNDGSRLRIRLQVGFISSRAFQRALDCLAEALDRKQGRLACLVPDDGQKLFRLPAAVLEAVLRYSKISSA